MATGFKIWQPNGKVITAQAGEKRSDDLLRGWDDYCERNWLNDDKEDMFSPEMRVKRFLDSVAYYLLYGNTDGIVTAYKELVNEAREIPVSACPERINNMLYATGGSTDELARDEELAFQTMTEILDDRVPKRKKQTQTKPQKSIRQKMADVRSENGGAEIERYTVDTQNQFWVHNNLMAVYDYPKYNAKVVSKRAGGSDILYDMDRIYRCGQRWYDQNGDPIPDECIVPIGGRVSYDDFMKIMQD